MSGMWIVAGDEGDVDPFYNHCGGSGCEIFTAGQAQTHWSAKADAPPDVLVLDTETVPAQSAYRLVRMVGASPSVSLVQVVNASNRHAALVPADRTISRPAGRIELRSTLNELWREYVANQEYTEIQRRLLGEMGARQLVGKSKVMQELVELLPDVAGAASTVLILGETGTGKELVARAIHSLGPRAQRPFVTVDCAALSESLAENELFGHARGAYTDGGRHSNGLVQEADGGTLFLDEVECLPLALQAKFLRLLQEREIKPLGQAKSQTVDVRIIAASNVDLRDLVRQRQFREDLYYRLSVVPIMVPPLRERASDIPQLVRYFLAKHQHEPLNTDTVDASVLRDWEAESWPGNVRELENRVQEFLATSRLRRSSAAPGAQPRKSLREIRADAEYRYLRDVLAETRGNLTAAASIAGMDRKSLRSLLNKCGLDAALFRK
ncbi:MAG: sigma-54 dependent transcriptional regulator [Bacteroidia bacterium]|nr:sigma-54 dependent transcriptional regulator [Bacteroidia bacterium]